MELHEKLFELRKQKKWSQLELAEKLNVSRQAISKWEQGTSVPSTENLIRLGELYGVLIDDIINENIQKPVVTEEQDNPSEQIPQRHSSKPKWNGFKIFLLILCLLIMGVIFFIAAFRR